MDGNDPAFRAQARASAVRTGLGNQKLFHLVTIIGILNALGVAPQDIGGNAFEAPLADSGWWFDRWEVAAKEGTLHAKEQKIALCWSVVFDRQREIQFEAVMRSSRLQSGCVVLNVMDIPAEDRALGDVLLLIHQAFEVRLMHRAQPGAGGTSPIRFIKGKMSHTDLWNRRAAMWAGKGFFRRSAIVVRAGFGVPFCLGSFEGGRNIFSTVWARAMSQTGK